MNFLKKISPAWLLRLGMGFMYLYSGYDLMVNPQHWYGFVPKWLSRIVTTTVSVDTYLFIQGVGEFVLGMLLLVWFLPKRIVRVAAVLIATEIALILFFVGIDPITFRDIGLLGAAGALVVFSFRNNGIR